LAILALLTAACGAGESTEVAPSSTVPLTSAPENPTANDGASSVVLLSGSFQIPAAASFDDPGFHETLVVTGAVPDTASGASGELVVRLFDIGQPNRACDRDHPLSGCATVDWSDFENRPGVPTGGVFDNRLRVVSTSTAVDFFLSERRGLAMTPDEYSPT
jgi:hypothetical protein